MTPMVMDLSDADISDLATWFASIEITTPGSLAWMSLDI
jgi:cytochrome c553